MIPHEDLDLTGWTIIQAGDDLIPVWRIERIDIREIEQHRITIYADDRAYVAEGIHAIEAMMVLKPSALEGRRLKWSRNAYWFHNLIVHPALQIMAWAGYKRQAVAFHDRYTPRPLDPQP